MHNTADQQLTHSSPGRDVDAHDDDGHGDGHGDGLGGHVVLPAHQVGLDGGRLNLEAKGRGGGV